MKIHKKFTSNIENLLYICYNIYNCADRNKNETTDSTGGGLRFKIGKQVTR